MKYKNKTMYKIHHTVTTPTFLQLTWPHQIQIVLRDMQVGGKHFIDQEGNLHSGHKHRHQHMGACVQAGEWWCTLKPHEAAISCQPLCSSGTFW